MPAEPSRYSDEVLTIHNITGLPKNDIKIMLEALHPALMQHLDDNIKFHIPKVCTFKSNIRLRKQFYSPYTLRLEPPRLVQETEVKLARPLALKKQLMSDTFYRLAPPSTT